MQDYQREFLDFAIARGALRFGEFILKSGRISPYFFDAGLFDSGQALAKLGRYYARAIVEAAPGFDMLFGPAYKGIPLAAATAIALAEHHGQDVPWSFNRKEVKDHGEGGTVVGAPLKDRVLIVDDVITAGTAVGESIALLRSHGAEASAIMIALDRQERGKQTLSAIQEIERDHGIPVVSIVTMDQVDSYLQDKADFRLASTAIKRYRELYGIGR